MTLNLSGLTCLTGMLETPEASGTFQPKGSMLLAQGESIFQNPLFLGPAAIFLFMVVLLVFFVARYWKLWFQAYMSAADVQLHSLIRMHFTKVNPNVVVQAKVMSAQAELDTNRNTGISTRRLEALWLVVMS